VIARAGVASTASTRTVFDTNAGLKTSVTGPVNVRQEGEEPGDDDYCVERGFVPRRAAGVPVGAPYNGDR
jgi:hypothetical protein